MRIPNKILLFFIEDAQHRSCTWNGANVVMSNTPVPLNQHPDGWKDLQIKFNTNAKYWSMVRSFSIPLKFINDGANILRWYAYKKAGYEQELYIKIMKWDRESGIYKLEYRGRLDFNTFNDSVKNSVSVNSIEGGPFTYISANEGVTYEIPCDATNPAALKVLFDGMNFRDSLNYISGWNEVGIDNEGKTASIIPMSFLDNNTANFGIVNNTSVSAEQFKMADIASVLAASANYAFYGAVEGVNIPVRVSGKLKMINRIVPTTLNVNVFLRTSSGVVYPIANNIPLTDDSIHPTEIDIPDVTFNLAYTEKLFLIVQKVSGTSYSLGIIAGSEIHFEVLTKNQPTTAYGLRGIDLLQQLVVKMTDGKYAAESAYLTTNNRCVFTSGTSLRNIPGATIKTTLQDLFNSCDPDIDWGLRIVNNVIRFEPKKDLYGPGAEIFDLGEASDVELLFAADQSYNSIKIGGPTQDNNNVNSGRLEVNAGTQWGLPVSTLNKELNCVSKYREDPTGIEFIRTKYTGNDNTNDSGDNDTFKIMISDDQDGEGNYLLSRPAYSNIEGVVDNTIYNTELSPKRKLLAKGGLLRSMLYFLQDKKVSFRSHDRNKSMRTTLDGVTIVESADISVGNLAAPFFIPIYLKFTTKTPYRFSEILSNLATAGVIKTSINGYPINLLPIGDMSARPATDTPQEWKLLLSSDNDLNILMLLSQNALFIKDFNNNMLYISPLNPLHFVKYDYALHAKYHHKEIYDDFFHKRNDRFIVRPDYFQPFQKTDSIELQFISAGLGALTIKAYNSQATLVDDFPMEIVSEPAIVSPYVLQRVSISLTGWEDDHYVFTVLAGDVVMAISEWVNVKEDHPETCLFEYFNSVNLQNAFFTTWRPKLRVEALMLPWRPDSSFTDYEDEQKDVELINATPSKVRRIVLGPATGIPDWMAMKLNEVLLLNRVYIEGGRYTRTPDSKLEPSELQGYPMSYYSTEIKQAVNDGGLTIDDTNVPIEPTRAALTLDAEAFGRADGVLQIEIESEP